MAAPSGEEYAIDILSAVGVQELIVNVDGRTGFEVEGIPFYYSVTLTEEDDLVLQLVCVIAEGLNPSESLLRAVAFKNPMFASIALDEFPDKTATLVLNADLIVGWNKDADVTAASFIIRNMHSQVLGLLKTWSRFLN